MNKRNIIAKAAAEAVIEYLDKNNASDKLSDVVDELKKEVGKNTAQVFTPRKLTTSETENIEILVNKLTGKSAEIEYLTDAKLLDGIKIICGDKVWDYSLSRKIRNFNI